MNNLNNLEQKYAPASVVQLADILIKMKKEKNPWTVIKFIVDGFKSTRPAEYKSFIEDIKINKETRNVTSVGGSHFTGVSKDKETGGRLRYKMDIPVTVVHLIRKLYTPEELPMDMKFYDKLGRMYPEFIISKKV